MPLPPHRSLPLIFGGAAVVAILSTLAGLGGGVSDGALLLALAVAAGYVVLMVRRPVARWALVAGIVALAATTVVDRGLPAEPAVRDIGAVFGALADAEHTALVILLLAVGAFLVGVAALPQFRRPAWLTAVAGLVALAPVAVVASDAAGQGNPYFPVDLATLFRHLAPGLAATVLAGLALVLAVSRADRWFLLPAGALLLELTAAQWVWGASGTVATEQVLRTPSVSAAFLEPGLRMDKPASATAPVVVDLSAALWITALLLAVALLAAGAARTTGPALGPAPDPGPPAADPGPPAGAPGPPAGD